MTPDDLTLAASLADEIVRLGGWRVRRVVLIGSRAHGRARPDSDLDLVVVLELPRDAPPWDGDDFARSGRTLEAALGPRPIRPDVRVRTTDRYAEARDVPGGVEWLAEHEGVPLFESPVRNPPRPRIPKEDVRREMVSAWVHHAIAAIEAFGDPKVRKTPRVVAAAAIERLIAAVLVHHRRNPKLVRDLGEYARQLPPEAIPAIAAIETSIRDHGSDGRKVVVKATREVLTYLRQDAEQRLFLAKARERLNRLATSTGKEARGAEGCVERI